MKRLAELVFAFELESKGAVAFGDELEVSLDCSHCQRARRTVVFKVGEPLARCCPGSGKRPGEVHPPYPGRIVERRCERAADGFAVTGTYRIEYEVSRFVDLKYGDHSGYPTAWTGRPTWGRVAWTLTCDSCGKNSKHSTQTNIVRPWTARCSCGTRLYVETREMPLLRWLDPETGEWCQAEERFGSPNGGEA
ncbi:MAG TPA: hypothetical protein VFF73_28780 [Planctomycetota bacterium]|nr:hypothetical protein [Planctomycetota bacterium]